MLGLQTASGSTNIVQGMVSYCVKALGQLHFPQKTPQITKIASPQKCFLEFPRLSFGMEIPQNFQTLILQEFPGPSRCQDFGISTVRLGGGGHHEVDMLGGSEEESKYLKAKKATCAPIPF